MMQDPWNITAPTGLPPQSKSAPCSPMKPLLRPRSELFHVAHKVPVSDTPYVTAKRVQLVDKDPEKAIALFWAAINAGDRVDSALKDMAIVMKQQNRAEEAIEAIKSLRHRCSRQAQESLDNILLDLYKRCGRLDDQIALLKHKLLLMQQGLAFNGKHTKTARSQGRKFQVSIKQETTRLLGNLGWALMQKENYVEAEAAYRRALLMEPDNNKMCNLGICLMKQGRIAEAKETLKQVKPAAVDALRGADSHLKAFARAQEMLQDLESKLAGRGSAGRDKFNKNWFFDALLGSSSIWQPQPCIDYQMLPLPQQERFAHQNADMNQIGRTGNVLRFNAPPFYAKSMKNTSAIHHPFRDPLSNLKRTRSGSFMEKPMAALGAQKVEELNGRRKSSLLEETGDKWIELPDDDAFSQAIVAAVLAPVLEDESTELSDDSLALCEEKMGKRLRVFQDISVALSSSKA